MNLTPYDLPLTNHTIGGESTRLERIDRKVAGMAGGALLARISSKLRRLWDLTRRGEGRRALQELGRLLWSTSEEYGMRRDLSLPFATVPEEIEVTVRPLETRDLDYLLSADSGDSAVQLWRQRRLLDADIPACWVAVDSEERPCFMVWLIRSEFNDRMQREIGPTFVPLASDEVLLDSGFTPQRYRGMRMGPAVAPQMAAIACPDARWVWAYTSVDNYPALTSLRRVGFEPAAILRSKWRLLRHKVEFERLPAGTTLPLGRG